MTLPRFQKDLVGTYDGSIYSMPTELRVLLAEDPHGFRLTVETGIGVEVGNQALTMVEAEGIIKMASTDHDIGVYEDDWTFPVGMRRVLTWTLETDSNYHLVLNEADIDEVATWLRYATGEEQYEGDPDIWENP